MNKKTPFLSIIVPAYNIEQYLHQCVDSILAQTFSDFEVILVDDGSTDDTARICDTYEQKDTRIHVIHKKNGGLVSARKAGLLNAAGSYIGYVDGDDWVKEDMFQCLCEVASRENADIVICDFFQATDNCFIPVSHNMNGGIFDKEKLDKDIFPIMLSKGDYFQFGFFPAVWCKLFRKSLLLEHQLAVTEEIKMGEDAACFYPCMLEAEKVVYLKNNYLYFYRMRDTSISHSMIRTFYAKEIVLLIEGLSEKFKKHALMQENLMKQLFLYEAYMLDNLFTPHITVKELFFSKNMTNQILLLSNNAMFLGLWEYSLSVRTSSRMKRLINMIHQNTIWNRLLLLLFRKYEQLQFFIQ